MEQKVAGIAGCGVIGRSWALLFALAGWSVRLYDGAPGVADSVFALIRDSLAAMGHDGDERQAVLSRLSVAGSLRDAVEDAHYVQESVAEKADIKRSVFQALAECTHPEAVLASSCSAIPPDDFLSELSTGERMLIAHSFNPPHLIPLVELVPSSATADATVERAASILREVGQHPVLLRRPVPGFIGNRLQAAVVNEAMHLVAEGIASPDDIDATLRLGLAGRWSLMGPFETMDLDADGGIAEYIDKFGRDYQAMGRKLGVARPWTRSAINGVRAARRARLALGDLPARRGWRDLMLLHLRRTLSSSNG